MLNLKYALRTLFKSPFVTVVAIVSLALGIGANAAIFSIFNEFLLRPLPVQQPEQLVNLAAPGPKPGSDSCNNAGDCDEVFSYPMFRDLERVQTVFTGIAAHRLFSANLAYRGQTINARGLLVSGSYFPVLGLQPVIGRLLGPGDDAKIGESHVVVLGHAYWQTRFAANPNVLNDTLIVNGQALTIVGVAPPGFDGTTLGSLPLVYVPITLRGFGDPDAPKQLQRRDSYWAYLFARLKPGVSLAQAHAGLNVPYHAIINDLEAPEQKNMSPQTMARFRAKEVGMKPGSMGQTQISREAKAPLIFLLCVTGLVLLIACANIANLLLARSAARSGEMAIRLSIGASRRQLIAQLLTESCLLAAFGGVAGVLVAYWTLVLITSLLPTEAVASMKFGLDLTALLFVGALALGTGLLFGLFPALNSTSPDLLSSLKGTSGQPSGARGAARFRTGLATFQIALSMLLLVGAGLFTRSLMNVSRVNLGLDIDNLVTFGLSPELNAYTPERSAALFERLEQELAATPGVSGVTASLVPLIDGDNWGSDVSVQGFQRGPDTDANARFNEVGAGYFRTLRIPLIAGREFTTRDTRDAAKVAIVNEAFAKKFNLGHDAVGKFMANGGGPNVKLDMQIVGLVKDAKYSQVKQEIPPLFFIPYRQDKTIGQMNFYIRTSLDPEQMMPTLQKVVARLDPNLPVEGIKTMTRQVKDNVFLDHMISVLSAAFAALATLLAAVGLYGVLAYTVSQRTREIGLRMALGAAPERVRRMVFELKGRDPLVLAAAALALATVALAAGFIPAHRASRIDPMRALRYE